MLHEFEFSTVSHSQWLTREKEVKNCLNLADVIEVSVPSPHGPRPYPPTNHGTYDELELSQWALFKPVYCHFQEWMDGWTDGRTDVDGIAMEYACRLCPRVSMSGDRIQ